MGKAAKCIQMLQILRSGRTYKTEVLASLMQTNPRNIIEYRKALNEANEYIVGGFGTNGGYRLALNSLMPATRLSAQEVNAIKGVAKALENEDPSLASALHGVLSGYESNDFALNHPLVPTPLKGAYEFLEDALHARRAVIARYKGEEKILSPAWINHTSTHLELLAMDHGSKRLGSYPLSSLKELSLSDEPYLVPAPALQGQTRVEARFVLPLSSLPLVVLALPEIRKASSKGEEAWITAAFPDEESALAFAYEYAEHVRLIRPLSLLRTLNEQLAEAQARFGASKAK